MQFETLQKDMIAAMKARDKVRKDAISTLVSAAKKAAIDEGCRDDIKEELVNRVILKEMKFCIYKKGIDSSGIYTFYYHFTQRILYFHLVLYTHYR